MQAATREREEEEEGKIYGKMLCQVCGKDGAKRCAGCGKVGYCGKGCQSMGWKEHRRECGRGHKPNKKREEGEGEGMKVPYETI